MAPLCHSSINLATCCELTKFDALVTVVEHNSSVDVATTSQHCTLLLLQVIVIAS